tara:strand:- start:96 stop:524 length:429 start_codon:yes stop_codon:yes gene_type:complete
MKKHIFYSYTETQKFAESFSEHINPGQIIALIGDLGSGKTTFSQGFARGLGIKEKVISPTFKLVSEYYGQILLLHIDCYRLKNINEFLIIGGEEILSKKDAIVLIEWPERIKSMWSDDWIYISFKMSKKEPDVREVIIEGFQ